MVALNLIALDAGDVRAVEVAVDGRNAIACQRWKRKKWFETILPCSIGHSVLSHCRALGKCDIGCDGAAWRRSRAGNHVGRLIRGGVLSSISLRFSCNAGVPPRAICDDGLRTTAAIDACRPLIVWNGICTQWSVFMQLPVARPRTTYPKTSRASARFKARQLRRHLKRVLRARKSHQARSRQSLQAVHLDAKYQSS